MQQSLLISYGTDRERRLRRRQPPGSRRTTNCWPACVWTESIPVTAEPDEASALRSWLPPPVRPLTADRVQFAPLAEVQTAASRVPLAASGAAVTGVDLIQAQASEQFVFRGLPAG